MHHVTRDWAQGGNTNVDEMGLACGSDNRMVDDDGGWSTTMNGRGEVEWAPPPDLDTGQARINYYHRPERLLAPPEDPEPGEPERCDPLWGNDTGELGEPAEPGDPGEPGGPAPPRDQAA